MSTAQQQQRDSKSLSARIRFSRPLASRAISRQRHQQHTKTVTHTVGTDHRDGGSSREAAGAPSPPVKREGEGEGEWEEGDEWLADVGEEETPISHPLCSSSTFSIATRDVAGSTPNDSKSQQGESVGEPCVGSNTTDEPRGVCSPSPSPGSPMSVPCGSAPSSPTATPPPLAFVLTESVTFVAEKRLTGGRGHCEVLEGRLHVTEGGVTTTRHAVIMKSAARGDPQRRDNQRTAEHYDRRCDEYKRGANMEAEGQWAEYINSFATAAQRQEHQHQYNRFPETHTGTAHIVPQVHIRSNRQPEEPQTEGQGHFGDHYAVFDKVGNGKELEDVIFDSTCGSDDYGAVVGVNVLLCMLGLHALGVTHNDYHYGNLLVADEATGGLKVIDLESLRKVVGHCEILEGRLHVTEGGVTTTRHAVIMKSAARGDPQRRDSERTAEHLDRQWNESLRGVNMEAEGQWAYYINSFATAAQGQDHQHQYNRLPETHTGTAHIVPQVHIRSNRQPEEPQTEGQGHFGDHYAVFDKARSSRT
ncbi:unnamed protein product [Vitrella brassicaformis CCMP3155]|uniref:Protein kinase domain-containing protein n=1 Tax=Vitrella brassicaformis (strain CCMP3155) TaxID=1169540 RepID=A0A0G4FZ94_VITBC|nr:unnamed protein product [Vitrella brassicaformis CCMP3155]|eukprot:CEM20950.1 unnamed protein product [Vitrella brassicaformis CCMP3155]